MNTQLIRKRSLLTLSLIVGLASLAGCGDDKKDSKSAPTGAKASGAAAKLDTSQGRVGIEWCDKLLEAAECTAPKYKKQSEQVEAVMVWRMRTKKWKAAEDKAATNAECRKKYKGAKEFAPKYEDGRMSSCYKYSP